MKWLIKLCLLLPLLAEVQAQELTIKIPSRPVPGLDESYFVPLLELALQKAEQPYRLERVKDDLNQFNLTEELRHGRNINLFWMGTSPQLEAALTAVPVPLLRGLEGLRISLIHQDAQEKFNQVTRLADLKPYKIGQGIGWSDNAIYEAAGLPTYAARYSSLFRLINDGDKLDLFPRSVVEVFAEHAAMSATYAELAVEQRLLLRYPFAQFFFVSPKFPAIAAALELGLTRAYADGSFLRFFNAHPAIQAAIAQANLPGRVTIALPAPQLLPTLSKIKPEFWQYPPQP
ncbi:MAG: hypothetical protein ACRCYV_02880 [Aeromonas sp.]